MTGKEQSKPCPWIVIHHENEWMVQQIDHPFHVAYGNESYERAMKFMEMCYENYLTGETLTNDAGITE